jgi:hypothetical protein
MRRPARMALGILLIGAFGRGAEPRTVLEQAVKAMGLDIDPTKRPAIVLHFRGQTPGGFRTEGTIVYGTNGARRLLMSVHEGNELRMTGPCLLLTSTGGSVLAAHGIADLAAEDLAKLRATETLLTPLALISLLEAKDVAFKEVDEIKIEGRTARRIHVTIQEEIVHLDFDSQTRLLVRATAKFNGITVTSTFRDYGQLDQDADARVLKNAGISDAGFLSFLRRRSRNPRALADAIELVPELGDDNYDRRERAAAALIDLGDSVIPVVRLALRDRDPEVVRQARHILEALEKRTDPAVVRAAIRQTVRYRLKGSVPALLALVPDATLDERRDIEAALFALRETDGQLEPTLVRSLDDPDPKIRAVAEAIHGKDRETLAKQPGRRLFPNNIIRLPARSRAESHSDTVNFEVVDVQLFSALDVTFFHKP